MTRALAINVGANTNQPGFRGPIYGDGSFVYVPIPESEPADPDTPTYSDLSLDVDELNHGDLPSTRVHLDPEFVEYPECDAYTYGDEHGVKARPISRLSEGDYLLFYATLSYRERERDEGSRERRSWVNPDWGAYLIGGFRLASDPFVPDGDDEIPEVFSDNAHLKRDDFDAEVLVEGDDESKLYETAVPLSDADDPTEPNDIVTELSEDSGKGPWFRRPLRFDDEATETLAEIHEREETVELRK